MKWVSVVGYIERGTVVGYTLTNHQAQQFQWGFTAGMINTNE